MRGRSGGLTIAETVVAFSLISLLLIAVVNLFPSALTTVELTRQRNKANWLAHDALEWVAGQPFSSLQVGVQNTSSLPVASNMSLTVEVLTVPGYEPELLLEVRSTVTWLYRERTRQVVQELYVHPARS